MGGFLLRYIIQVPDGRFIARASLNLELTYNIFSAQVFDGSELDRKRYEGERVIPWAKSPADTGPDLTPNPSED